MLFSCSYFYLWKILIHFHVNLANYVLSTNIGSYHNIQSYPILRCFMARSIRSKPVFAGTVFQIPDHLAMHIHASLSWHLINLSVSGLVNFFLDEGMESPVNRKCGGFSVGCNDNRSWYCWWLMENVYLVSAAKQRGSSDSSAALYSVFCFNAYEKDKLYW